MAKSIENPNDIVNLKFGKLKVVKYVGVKYSGRNRDHLYECVCDCSKVGVVTKRSVLLKGDKISCGCAHKGAGLNRKENFVGRRFGRWTVLEPAPTRYSMSGKTRSIMWKCKCDCAAIKNIGARALKTGMSLSCGCLQKERASKAVVDNLMGKSFGLLTVIGRSGSTKGTKRGISRHAKWHCKCKCGKEVSVIGFSLKNGDTTSCGCRKSSKYEDMVAIYLESCGYVKGVDYFREKTFQGLLGVGGGLLRVDFFVHLHDGVDLIIECQGKQHYKSTKWYGGQEYLQKVQMHDKKKQEYARTHNIQYVQVSYKDVKYDQVVRCLLNQGVV